MDFVEDGICELDWSAGAVDIVGGRALGELGNIVSKF